MSRLTTNTDRKERRKFEVIQLKKNSPDSIDIDGRKLKVGRSGGFTTSDYGLAKEIEARAGVEANKDFLVIPVEKKPDPGHRRTWLVKLPKNYKG